jgi:ubiquitin C-terminal hydrolase
MTSDDSFHPSETTLKTNSSISKQPLKSKSFSLLNSKVSLPDYFCGLKNPSNFCYLNSYLQVLFHIPAFRGMILNQQYPKQCGPIVLSLKQLFTKLSFKWKPVSSFGVISSFGWTSSQIESQHDVHEFSRIFLEDLKREILKFRGDISFFNFLNGKMQTLISFENHPSIISEYNFSDISLSIEKSSSLEEALNLFTSEISLSGQNAYELPNGSKENAHLKYSFYDLPAILHIQFNRFYFDFRKQISKKTIKNVKFPKILNFKKYCTLPNNNTEYQLYAVLFHEGTSEFGHYFVNLNFQMKSEWYLFDDETFKFTSHPLSDIINPTDPTDPTPYILIYIRTDCIVHLFGKSSSSSR